MKIEYMEKNGYCEGCINLRSGQIPCRGLTKSKECPISVKESVKDNGQKGVK